MASDRTPLTQRLKSLTSRQRDTPPAATTIPADPGPEQPTSEFAAIQDSSADQPTAEHLAVAPAEPVAASPAPEAEAATTEWPVRTPTPEFPAPHAAEPVPVVEQPAATPAAPDEPALGDAFLAGAPAEPTPAEPAAPESPTLSGRARSGLGGLGARLKRDRAAAPAPAEAPTPETTQAEPVAAAAPAPAEPARPSFGERASLRRRAKTLRARRDAGLLELGAIVLDQRRFGDPTEGSLVRRRTDELADLDSELAAIEQVLDDDGPAETVAQLGVVRCLDCAALVGPRDQYCVACGAPRPVGEAAPPAPSA